MRGRRGMGRRRRGRRRKEEEAAKEAEGGGRRRKGNRISCPEMRLIGNAPGVVAGSSRSSQRQTSDWPAAPAKCNAVHPRLSTADTNMGRPLDAAITR